MAAKLYVRKEAYPRRGMTKIERLYAEQLQARQLAGEVLWFEYEGITLKLGPDTRYTPDFVVCLVDHSIELHEVKQGWRDRQGRIAYRGKDDSDVKVRLASARWTVRRAVHIDGAWLVHEV